MKFTLTPTETETLLLVLPLLPLDPESTPQQSALDEACFHSVSRKFRSGGEPLTPLELTTAFTAVGFALDILNGNSPDFPLSTLPEDYQADLVRHRFPLSALYQRLDSILHRRP